MYRVETIVTHGEVDNFCRYVFMYQPINFYGIMKASTEKVTIYGNLEQFGTIMLLISFKEDIADFRLFLFFPQCFKMP